ncbi:hypothetical protein ACFY4V_29345 [Streptomyces misionensis]|uniref:hypothetical protein n=1 Tax=Streptomyces misionensis TaxID=67331 RepID=UPI0036A4F94A
MHVVRDLLTGGLDRPVHRAHGAALDHHRLLGDLEQALPRSVPHVLAPADLGDQTKDPGTESGVPTRRDPEQERHRQCSHRGRAALMVKIRPELPQSPVGGIRVFGAERPEEPGDLLARAVEVWEPLPRNLVVPEPVLDFPRDRAHDRPHIALRADPQLRPVSPTITVHGLAFQYAAGIRIRESNER